MTFFLFLSDRHGSNSGTRWAIIGMAIKIAQSVSMMLIHCKGLTKYVSRD